MRRTTLLFSLSALILAGCEGTQSGKAAFGTPSNNHVTTFRFTFPTPPVRSVGLQFLALQVDALDTYNNVITVPYEVPITLSSNGGCEVSFSFYQTAGSTTTPPQLASVNYNTPQEIAVRFDPTCGGPNPVVITASAPNATSASLNI